MGHGEIISTSSNMGILSLGIKNVVHNLWGLPQVQLIIAATMKY